MEETDPYASAINKIRKIADTKRIKLESIASTEKLEAERKEKEKEAQLFRIAQKEAERLEKERIEKILVEKSKLDAEMLKYKADIEKLKNKLKQQEKNLPIVAAKELKKLNKKLTSHNYIEELLIISEKIQPDRRIRFSLPPDDKKKLVIGKKLKFGLRLLPN